VLRERTTVETFRAWWDRDATRGMLGALTQVQNPPGRKAVGLFRAAVEDHRARRIGDEDLLDLLVLAREALRGRRG
jgi:hypothetical protein